MSVIPASHPSYSLFYSSRQRQACSGARATTAMRAQAQRSCTSGLPHWAWLPQGRSRQRACQAAAARTQPRAAIYARSGPRKKGRSAHRWRSTQHNKKQAAVFCRRPIGRCMQGRPVAALCRTHTAARAPATRSRPSACAGQSPGTPGRGAPRHQSAWPGRQLYMHTCAAAGRKRAFAHAPDAASSTRCRPEGAHKHTIVYIGTRQTRQCIRPERGPDRLQGGFGGARTPVRVHVQGRTHERQCCDNGAATGRPPSKWVLCRKGRRQSLSRKAAEAQLVGIYGQGPACAGHESFQGGSQDCKTLSHGIAGAAAAASGLLLAVAMILSAPGVLAAPARRRARRHRHQRALGGHQEIILCASGRPGCRGGG